RMVTIHIITYSLDRKSFTTPINPSTMLISLVLLVLATSAYTSAAPSANKLIVLGNSISDTGNIYNVTLHAMPDSKHYYKGRFTNGPNWVDHLETKLKVPVKNFAFGGATSNNAVVPALTPIPMVLIPSVHDQAKFFYTPTVTAHSESVRDTLHVIEVANNDYLYTEGERRSVNQTLIERCASSIVNTVDYLHTTLGARKFLVFGVAALARTPHFKTLPQKYQEETERVTTEHNRLLLLDLQEYQGKNTNTEIYYFDLKKYMEAEMSRSESLGFKDINHSCYDDRADTICSNPDEHLFWDRVHPTTKGHQLLMEGVLDASILVTGTDSRKGMASVAISV
ncbi:GDSL-like Lipase/Acylhydrolase-domain-containing protein, partial [Syncephalis plumigaleata]